MTDDIPIIERSGNVKDPKETLAKAKLVQQIAALVRARKLTHAAAAELCGIDQPKMSKLLKG